MLNFTLDNGDPQEEQRFFREEGKPPRCRFRRDSGLARLWGRIWWGKAMRTEPRGFRAGLSVSSRAGFGLKTIWFQETWREWERKTLIPSFSLSFPSFPQAHLISVFFPYENSPGQPNSHVFLWYLSTNHDLKGDRKGPMSSWPSVCVLVYSRSYTVASTASVMFVIFWIFKHKESFLKVWVLLIVLQKMTGSDTISGQIA